LAWTDMVSKPKTAAEREELRKSIDSLVKDLDNLRTKLDQLPKADRARRRWSPLRPFSAEERVPGGRTSRM